MRVGRAFLQTLLVQVIQSVASIATGILIARGLGPVGQGQFAVLFAATTLLATVAAAGQFEGNVLTSAGRSAAGRILLVRSAIQALIAAVLLVATQGLWRAAGEGVYANVVGIMAFIVSLETMALLFRGINLGQHQITTYNLVTLAQRIVFLSFILLLLRFENLRLVTVLLSWLAAAALNVVVNAMWIWRHSDRIPLDFRRVVTGWGSSLRNGARALVTIVLTLLLVRTDIYMLGPMLNVEAVGQMSVASTLAEYLWYVPSILGSMLFAAVAADRGQETIEKVCRSTRTMIALLAPVAIILFLLGRVGVPWLYGRAYAQAGVVFVVLVPGMFALAIHLVLDSYFSGSGFPPVSYLAVAAALVLKVVLNVALVPRFGVNGAAAATSVVYVLLLLTKVIAFHRATGVPISHILKPQSSDVSGTMSVARGWIGSLRGMRA
jgi:O-antigen/teichoic acid export membrane protein